MSLVTLEIEHFIDPTTGKPISNGDVYIGESDLDPEVVANQKTIRLRQEDGVEVATTQPVSLGGGGVPLYNGSPVQILVEGDYSLKVLDKNGAQVYYVSSALDVNPTSVLNISGTYPTLADLRLAGTYTDAAAYLRGRTTGGDGGQGWFRWDSSDLSSEVSADTQSGIYVAPAGEDGSTGAWVRQYAEAINLRWFGAVEGASNADMYTAVSGAWSFALANTLNIYAPSGTYEIGDVNFPWRQQGTPVGLLDCGNITLFGDGPATIFATNSPDGADVFQLNGMQNFHIRDLKLTATLSGFAGSGTNGISITNGFDNITIDRVFADELPYVDATSFVDGGKALTVQPSTTGNICGSLKARIIVNGCAYGFGCDYDLVTMASKKTSIDVDLTARDCYRAVALAAGAATAPIDADTYLGINVKAQAIDCQQDVVVNRMHGIKVDCQVITTKTAANRRLSPRGVAWLASDTVVNGLFTAYVHRGSISIAGDKGECDYKARIGGSTAGSSGLIGDTLDSQIFVDIGGTAATADVEAINSGGNIVRFSTLIFTRNTLTTIPSLFITAAYENTVVLGTEKRLNKLKVSDHLAMAFATDGTTETGRLDLFGSITGIQGKATAVSGSIITGLYDQAGTLRLGIRNGNGLVIDSATTSNPLGAYQSKYAVYDSAGTFIGYLPLYL